jgi:hypothetical protein
MIEEKRITVEPHHGITSSIGQAVPAALSVFVAIARS